MKIKFKLYILFTFFLILISFAFLIRKNDWYEIFSVKSNQAEFNSATADSYKDLTEGSNFSSSTSNNKNDLEQSEIQSTEQITTKKNRNYKFDIKQYMKVEFPVSEGMFRFNTFKNQLYFADQSHQIWKLDLEDLSSKKLVEAGDAPHENQNVSSVIADDKGLYIVDIDKRSFRRQDFEGNVTQQDLKLNYITYNGIYLNENYGISLRDDKSNSAFEIYNFDSLKIEKEYNLSELFNLIKDKEFAEIITEGYFVGDLELGAIYVPGRFGEFIMFDSVGKIKYRGFTIDGTEKPRVKTEKVFGNSYMYFREPDYYVNYSASMNSKYLVILSLDGEKSTHTNLDFYAVSDGGYIGSAKIKSFSEERPKEVILTEEDGVWVLFENYTFVKYKYRKDEV